MKKLFSLALAFIMVISLSPFAFSASAAEARYTNSPTPFGSSDEETAALKKFQNTTPELHKESDSDPYYYYYANLSWEPVDRAILYEIYRKKPAESNYRKIGSTLDEYWYSYDYDESTYIYAVRAVSFDSDDNMVYSRFGSNSPPPFGTSDEEKAALKKFQETAPKLSGESDRTTDYSYARLSWEPVDRAIMYEISRKKPTDDEYVRIGTTMKQEWYDENYSDIVYSYVIRAVSFDSANKMVYSKFSQPFRVKAQNHGRSYDADAVDAGASEDVGSDSGPYSEAGLAEEDEYVEDVSSPAGIAESDAGYAPAIDFYDSLWSTDFNTEEYADSDETGFKSVADYPLSTFSADVDTAAYANLRRLINSNDTIPPSAIRIEEMLNYFDYNYKAPAGTVPFSITAELSDSPWNPSSKLLMVGIQGKDIPQEEIPASNLVFLVDVSGSMYSADKLPLVKKALINLAGTLSENDVLSIVTYSGNERVVLEGAKGSHINAVKSIMDLLEASGSTNGESGINMAYDIAEKYFIEGGNNRIIMATDGDLNVGVSSEGELTSLIEKKRESGVFLSMLGFGTENIKDNKMKALAANGNGNYNYIDSETEANKVLVEEKKGTLFTIAKDVKFQVEFNPKHIKGYRLIGYDYRLLQTEDFTDDQKDAGDIGAGHTVTVLYELIPAGGAAVPSTDLKYQETKTVDSEEWLTVKLRYKRPEESASRQVSKTVSAEDYKKTMSANMRFASGVAEFGMVLKESAYKGTSTLKSAQALLAGYKNSSDPYKKELYALIDKLIEE